MRLSVPLIALAFATAAAAQDAPRVDIQGPLSVLIEGREIKLGKVGGKSDLSLRLYEGPGGGGDAACIPPAPCAHHYYLAVAQTKGTKAALFDLGEMGGVLAEDVGPGAEGEAKLRLVVLPLPLDALLENGGTATVEVRDYRVTLAAAKRVK